MLDLVLLHKPAGFRSGRNLVVGSRCDLAIFVFGYGIWRLLLRVVGLIWRNIIVIHILDY